MQNTDPKGLECLCCYQKYNAQANYPRLMTLCGHSVCSSCLRQLISLQISKGQRAVECPFCKKEHPFSGNEAGQLPSFPKNFNLAELVTQIDSEQKKVRAVIIKQDDEHFLCKQHNKAVSLISKKTKDFLCVDCFMESHEAHDVVKLAQIKLDAFSKLDKLLDGFSHINSSFLTDDKKDILQELSQLKEKIIEKLKKRYDTLLAHFNDELQREQNRINTFFNNLEHIFSKDGLFKQNLAWKFNEDLPKLAKIKQSFEQNQFSLYDLKFLQFAEEFNGVNLLAFSTPDISISQDIRFFNAALERSLKSFIDNFVHVTGQAPLKIELDENKLTKASAAPILNKQIVITAKKNTKKLRPLLFSLMLADMVSDLLFEETSGGELVARFVCLHSSLSTIFNVLEENSDFKVHIQVLN